MLPRVPLSCEQPNYMHGLKTNTNITRHRHLILNHTNLFVESQMDINIMHYSPLYMCCYSIQDCTTTCKCTPHPVYNKQQLKIKHSLMLNITYLSLHVTRSIPRLYGMKFDCIRVSDNTNLIVIITFIIFSFSINQQKH